MEKSILELEGDRAALADYLHLIGHSDILFAFTCKPLWLRSVNVNDMFFFERTEVRVKCNVFHPRLSHITTALSSDVISIDLCISFTFVEGSCQMLV